MTETMQNADPSSWPLSRREMLRRSGTGFGMLGLAGVLAADGALASAAEAAPGGTGALAAEEPALRRQGPAGRAPVHERRPVAGRYVRSQAAARQASRPAAAGQPAHRAKDRRGDALAVQVRQIRPERHRGERAVRQDGPARRRHVHHPLDGRRRAESRAVADADELRRRPAAAAQLRLVGDLWPGLGESESAGLHRHVPRRLSDRGHAKLAGRVSAGRLPGHLHRHQAHRSRQADREHSQQGHFAGRAAAAARPGRSGSTAGTSRRGPTTPGWKPASNRSSWPIACSRKPPRRSTSSASRRRFARRIPTGLHGRQLLDHAAAAGARRAVRAGMERPGAAVGQSRQPGKAAPPVGRRLGPADRRVPGRS